LEECPVEIGQVVADTYRVDSLIGQGGMGVVVSAHHVHLEQRVAIKFLLSDIADHGEAAERFRREARAAAQIQSDHVVRVLDVGSLEGTVPYMVMEYLKGEDLGQVLANGRPLPIRDAVRYVLEACEAVGQAHAAGIIHRDLKPANLFLAERPDGSLRVKVLDFGISRSASDASGDNLRLTSTSTLIGSPLYMSPEQMRYPRDVDAGTDIWSLGAILYELLLARPPFEAETLPQLCELVLTEKPPRPSELRPEIPAELEAAVLRCLERERGDRWPNVAALAEALSPFLARRTLEPGTFAAQRELNSTIVMAPPVDPATPHEFSEGSSSRRRLAIGVAALALIGATGAVVVSSFGNKVDLAGAKPMHRIESAASDPGDVKNDDPATEPRAQEPETADAPTLEDGPTPNSSSPPARKSTRVEPVVDDTESKLHRRLQRASRVAAEAEREPPTQAAATTETKRGLPDFGGRR
jgi:serine/threonine-protein kinase